MWQYDIVYNDRVLNNFSIQFHNMPLFWWNPFDRLSVEGAIITILSLLLMHSTSC